MSKKLGSSQLLALKGLITRGGWPAGWVVVNPSNTERLCRRLVVHGLATEPTFAHFKVTEAGRKLAQSGFEQDDYLIKQQLMSLGFENPLPMSHSFGKKWVVAFGTPDENGRQPFRGVVNVETGDWVANRVSGHGFANFAEFVKGFRPD